MTQGPGTAPPSELLAALRCPVCSDRLVVGARPVRCTGCDHSYSGSFGGVEPLDLRPPESVRVSYEAVVGHSGPDEVLPQPLRMNPQAGNEPVVLAQGHTSAELISWIPPSPRPGALALDLGCGGGDSRDAIEAAGYGYVGADLDDPRAQMFADAHRLPFEDDTFDFVMSVAVLEHLHSPALAIAEVHRILRPGGAFLGTVAFLEPYHARSYFHHTALGVRHVLLSAGFELDQLWAAGPGWTLFDAQAKVLFKGAPPLLKRLLLAASRLPHELWWRVGRRRRPDAFGEDVRFATTAGAFGWLAHVPVAHGAGSSWLPAVQFRGVAR